ncbi:hypothetical protein R7P67_16160 [Vibrio sp. Vb0937]|uniref:hypothetical protein n=1 Tax=unclassified Vibrio TaxID=2614977 RepID=UPI0021D3DBC5|nr:MULTISPECIES: hypothetical protein [unclassified Vibrio]MDW1826568.1 hypothetical protein [Vibrio sp. Vb0937]MDW3188262.1 hypothetical protein [Vibrio sp. Vb0932]
MRIEIDDDDLEGFNDNAKNKLRETTEKYVSDLIEEAHRLESKTNSVGGTPEVTSSNVSDANILITKGLSQKKAGIGSKAVRIVAALLPLAVGAMYDSAKLQDGTYMFMFIGVVTLSIIAVTVSILTE